MKVFNEPKCVLETITRERWKCGIESHSHLSRRTALECINRNKDKKPQTQRLPMDKKIAILVDVINGTPLKKAGLKNGAGKSTALLHANDAAKYLAVRHVKNPIKKSLAVYIARVFKADSSDVLGYGARELRERKSELLSCIDSRPFGDTPESIFTDSPHLEKIINNGDMVEERDISQWWELHA